MARILHIEDDPNNRLLVRKLLKGAGHKVIDAANGLEGIHLAEQESPDLVLVDLYIPDLDGYEVTLRLRGIEALSHVPIVAITAEGDRERSLAVGADGFIAKPIDAASFPKTIARFLRGHRERGKARASQHLRVASQQIVERLERKIMELSDVNAQLEEMMRLRQEFLRNLSHELATPMTPIVGYLRLLIGEELGPLTPTQMKSLNAVYQSTERLRGLIDTLLDVSALETGRMHFHLKPYNFGQLAENALAQVRERFEKADIDLWVQPSAGALQGLGDTDKIRRAMVHILDNAVKFTPSGGQIMVAIEQTQEAEQQFYELRVMDSGPGVAPDKMSRVLDAFYQADGSVTRAHGGVGLGLAFARRVGEGMGGGVRLHSPPVHDIGATRLGGTEVIFWVNAEPRSSEGTRG